MKEEIQKKKLEKKEGKLYDKQYKIREKIKLLSDKIATEKFKDCIGKCYKSNYGRGTLIRVDGVDVEKQSIKVTVLNCFRDEFSVNKTRYDRYTYFWNDKTEVEADVFNKLYQKALNKMEKWQ